MKSAKSGHRKCLIYRSRTSMVPSNFDGLVSLFFPFGISHRPTRVSNRTLSKSSITVKVILLKSSASNSTDLFRKGIQRLGRLRGFGCEPSHGKSGTKRQKAAYRSTGSQGDPFCGGLQDRVWSRTWRISCRSAIPTTVFCRAASSGRD